ncbi:cyclohexadienyl dehydrogenase [Oceaniovalibus guishaninsula JLT2003]|uniref:Cyclohexadienyl dehydrogenase n=1 Tax=Oceaniovalibus guishaninsula JLT2003 TaxID=1231392 RepID=K2I9S2_9RHOB|nr:cyclohexadienyl dehydrogenase [Oceaniovalibus guishaninsula JLT2003]
MIDRTRRDAVPIFSQPVRQIVLMVAVLVLTAIGAWAVFPRVAPVFLANPLLNGFIGLVFVIGILACFWQGWQLIQSVHWIEGFAAQNPGHEFTRAPRLLAPLAALLRSRGQRMQIGATSSRSILDSVATRIDEARDITRYIVNLLIYLGLLGTFIGLATTVPAIVDTIRSLAPSANEDGMQVFGRLMEGLESQLGGMGVAFSSSLLGLAGSLVVGLLELFASHAQNRFYRELEEWLSSITRVGFAAEGAEGGDQAVAAAMMEHMADQVDRLRDIVAASDASRARTDDRMGDLVASIDRMTDRMDEEGSVNSALARVADGQDRLADILQAAQKTGAGTIDAESRMRLRSIDVQLLRLLEEIAAGRQETTAELRQELRQMARSLIRAQRGGAIADKQAG